MNSILTNHHFRKIIKLYQNIDNKAKNNDSSLIDDPNFVRLKDRVDIRHSAEENILLALFPILIFVSYVILVTVFYGFYLSSDAAGFRRSASMFILSIIFLSTFYGYRGNLFALKTLNILNTLSIISAIAILLLDYFIYYMNHEWYLLTIVFFNFFSNRVIINSSVFSQAMTETLWFKTKNYVLRRQLVGIIEGDTDTIESQKNSPKTPIFNMFWQYSVLNTNLNTTLKESDKLNQRVEKNDRTLLAEKRLNKYQHLLNFGVSKNALFMTLFAIILLAKAYVMAIFMLASGLDNENGIPIAFFSVAVAVIFVSLSILLTHRGISLGFKMLILARYLFIVLLASLIGLKFVTGILDYSNVSLCIIVVDFLLVFFMLNTQYYSNYLKELHCFLAWHKMNGKNSE
ncbi:hypothetical protein [Xenorhabdus bovienii]|uniref:hypothetical protein n=1 Tax=Xenorhabdus bovienii TaxID=40576 RepID=UPI003DA25A20